MKIRSFMPDDIEKIRQIHEKFYKEEFDLPNFLEGFHCVFTVESEEENIVTIGGVRPIAEIVAITDKGQSPKTRRNALYRLLDASIFVGGKFNYDALHCFVQDETWEKHLGRVGFSPTRGRPLVLSIG